MKCYLNEQWRDGQGSKLVLGPKSGGKWPNLFFDSAGDENVHSVLHPQGETGEDPGNRRALGPQGRLRTIESMLWWRELVWRRDLTYFFGISAAQALGVLQRHREFNLVGQKNEF